MSFDDVAGNPQALPSEVVIHELSRRLELRWPNGYGISLGHARLRSACKCAWCESARRRQPDAHIGSPDVVLRCATAVGSVGLQLHFSDGHDRGIYPWPYLRSLLS